MALASMAWDGRQNRALMYYKPAARTGGGAQRQQGPVISTTERTQSSQMADISVHMMAELNVCRICWSVVTRRFDVTQVLYSLTSLVMRRPTVRMGLESEVTTVSEPTVEIQIGINTGRDLLISLSAVRTN